jgi:hypothetical protein
VAQVLAVFVLYVRCAGCDPADRGVHQSKHAVRAKQRAAAALKAEHLTQARLDTCFGHSHDEHARNSASPKLEAVSGPSVWLCLPFASCQKENSAKLNSGTEQLLYCSICEAEVQPCFLFDEPTKLHCWY